MVLDDDDGGVGDEDDDVVGDEVDGGDGCGDEDDGDDEGHPCYLLRAFHISMGPSTDSTISTGASQMSQSEPSEATLCSGTCMKRGWRGLPGVTRLEHLGDTLGTSREDSWGLGRLHWCWD